MVEALPLLCTKLVKGCSALQHPTNPPNEPLNRFCQGTASYLDLLKAIQLSPKRFSEVITMAAWGHCEELGGQAACPAIASSRVNVFEAFEAWRHCYGALSRENEAVAQQGFLVFTGSSVARKFALRVAPPSLFPLVQLYKRAPS